ncbi:GNAT family N-acetyltransferase [Glycomyces sp. NRRL B-16210]|uniref:GNAT family N-acetyltransferase n=1 Tax=Glycomyces sp. NRRL B-16210 TaxID=1463821 RepID=UPI0004C22452|nr:GNAT family N-acetyltransferase [Glycomyces sp. NRRL B-16210]
MDDRTISTDPDRLDLDWIHKVLSTDTYWAVGRSKERVARSVEHSIVYGVYEPSGRQVAVARVVTDRTVFAVVSDVYVDPDLRGQGWGKRLVERVMADLDAMDVKRVVLATADAQDLYARFGFTELTGDGYTWMQRVWPDRV